MNETQLSPITLAAMRCAYASADLMRHIYPSSSAGLEDIMRTIEFVLASGTTAALGLTPALIEHLFEFSTCWPASPEVAAFNRDLTIASGVRVSGRKGNVRRSRRAARARARLAAAFPAAQPVLNEPACNGCPQP